MHFKVDLVEGKYSVVLRDQTFTLFENISLDVDWYPAVSLYGDGIKIQILTSVYRF